MTSYLVHVPAGACPGSAAELERTVLVKDGFHWLALLFPVLWLLYHRCWLVLSGYLVLAVALGFGAGAAGLPSQALVLSQLLLSAALAVFAPDVRSRTLVRRGWAFADIATGRSEEEAAGRFFARWIAAQASPSPGTGVSPRTGMATASNPVLGLFPQAGRP